MENHGQDGGAAKTTAETAALRKGDASQGVPLVRRRRLPHWEADKATYFVTFRLADSLPQKALQAVLFERRDILTTARQMKRDLSASEKARLRKLFSEHIERHLDAGAGECLLARPQIARVVANALKHFHGSRYQLLAWCVMPNHVHAVVQPLSGHRLYEILHSWKSFSGKQANQLLRRTGPFWQREYYDHLIRDEEDFRRILEYVLANPAKAGLKNWPWVGRI